MEEPGRRSLICKTPVQGPFLYFEKLRVVDVITP